MADQTYDTKTYFAVKPPNETASILLHKAFSFFNDMTKNNYLDKLRLMWKAYHGIYMDGADHEIAFTGEQGELAFVAVNHFRNIARNIYNMITSTRPTMDARAINTDYKSLAQATLANGILDYYMREKNLETVLKAAAEVAIFLGSGFVKLEWNATSGNAYDYDEETKTYNYEGEVEFSMLSPFDIVVDGTKNSWNHEWILVRTYQNRFNLMAKYPEIAEKIKGLPTKSEQYRYRLNLMSNDDTDDIAVYEFYHKKTEAVPDGRYLLFLDADVNLLDMALPYDAIPIYRIAAGEIVGTPYGYTDMFDIYPLQEVINATYSSIATTANTFGTTNVFIPEGANLVVESLEGGLNIIKGAVKPEALNLTTIPKELFDLLNLTVQSQETLSGVNSVARGNPEASLRTGTALALVQSMALQYSSSLQASYVKLIEDVGTGLLNILKRHANTPKLITLVGKGNRSELKEFVGDQIGDVNRVVVDMGNPLARTIAGRTQIASELLQMKMLSTPEQYLQVLKTGELDVTFEGTTGQLLCIKKENEMMLDGKLPVAVMLDQHSMHIAEHQAVISDPELRQDAELLKNVLAHIQEHITYLRTTDPALLSMIHEQPLPPAPGGPAPQPSGQSSPMTGQATPGQQPGNPPQPPGPGGPSSNGGQPPQAALQGNTQPQMMAANAGQVAVGQPISGPGIHNVPKPKVAKVQGNLLVNPALQQTAMGNVK